MAATKKWLDIFENWNCKIFSSGEKACKYGEANWFLTDPNLSLLLVQTCMR